MKSFILILFLIIGATQVKAAGSYTDLFHIGKVGTTANSVIELGDSAEFRYNFSTSKMQFSNDGITYYDVIGPNDIVTLTNKSFDVSANTLSNVVTTNLASGVLDTDLTTVSASDDTLGSAKAIKTYVDNQVSGGATPTLAKGGLITHSTVDVAQAVGSNGQVLTADSAQADGIKWATPAVAPAPDHTLTSGGTLQNKYLNTTNLIGALKYYNFMEVGDDSISGTGNRTSYVDLHSSGGVNYNFRMLRNGGYHGSMVLQQLGTGPTYFYNNGVISMGLTSSYIDARSKRIVSVATPSSSTDAANKAYVDANGGGGISSCTQRTGSSTAGYTYTSCAANEFVTGGGCQFAANAYYSTHVTDGVFLPVSTSTYGKSWHCSATVAGTTVGYAICCK